jgi:hypothetical protein
MEKPTEPKKYVTDYFKEVRAAGGELRTGNILYAEGRLGEDYLRKHGPKAFYYLIVSPKSGDEYAGFTVKGLGTVLQESETGFWCKRGGCEWGVSKAFYNKYKKLFDLADKFEKEFPTQFMSSQPTRR